MVLEKPTSGTSKEEACAKIRASLLLIWSRFWFYLVLEHAGPQESGEVLRGISVVRAFA